MQAVSCRRSETEIDCLTLVEAIRGVFARSLIFDDAEILESRERPGGALTLDVSFGHGPTALRVVAQTEKEAYAILHELASTMVEIERSIHVRHREHVTRPQ
jgi:hypothetical protein